MNIKDIIAEAVKQRLEAGPDKTAMKSIERHYSKYKDNDHEAISDYTSGEGSFDSNSQYLNKPLYKAKGAVPKEIKSWTDRTDALVARHQTPNDMTAYYGISRNPKLFSYGSNLIKNNKTTITAPFVFVNHGYTSTSLDPDIAWTFARNQLIDSSNKSVIQAHMLIIKIPKGFSGAYVGHLSAQKDRYGGRWDEMELILPRGTSFTISPKPSVIKKTVRGTTLYVFKWKATAVPPLPLAEGFLDEAVGGNYLYHATQPQAMMRILRSGAIKASYRPQDATKARTQLPTVSTTRSKQYAESDDFTNFLKLTREGNSVIIVFDRNAVGNHYKMFSTSQGAQTEGDEFEEVIVVPKGIMPVQGTMKGFYFNPKRTSEIEEFKDIPWFNELLNSRYYMGQTKGVAEGLTPNTIHKLADRTGVKWDNEPSFLRLTKRLTGKEHLDDLNQTELQKVKQYLEKQAVTEVLNETTLQLGPQLYTPHPKNLDESMKPKAALWTSTASGSNNGYTSAWVEWAKNEMPQWVGPSGFLYDVSPSARILTINSDRDAMRVANKYGMNTTDIMDLFMYMPWKKIAKDYDAIHHVPSNRGADLFMHGWDVESTAWFNTKMLLNKRKVPILASKKGVAEGPLNELFDGGKDWKWTYRDKNQAKAKFTVGDVDYTFSAGQDPDEAPGDWDVEFAATQPLTSPSWGLTGTGNSAQVLSTVVEIMKSFITSKKASIRRMTFAAKEDSRQSLYVRVIKRLLPKWNLEQSGGEFVLTRPGGLVFWVYSVEAPYNKIPAVKVRANTAKEAEQIVLTTMPKFKGADLMSMGASKNKPNLQGVAENFADGRNPQDRGDSARHGIPKGATMAQLEKAAKAQGRKGQLARWQLNMRRGKKK